MLYTDFAREVKAAGLQPAECSEWHWQIQQGTRHKRVNVWPNGRRGFGFALDNQRWQSGTLADAIACAGPPKPKPPEIVVMRDDQTREPAPWEPSGSTAPHRGLIRTVALFVWKWLW